MVEEYAIWECVACSHKTLAGLFGEAQERLDSFGQKVIVGGNKLGSEWFTSCSSCSKPVKCEKCSHTNRVETKHTYHRVVGSFKGDYADWNPYSVQ